MSDDKEHSMHETAILGGGCFWCLEAVFDLIDGVDEVVPGYCGGHVELPSYRDVCTGGTGHAEVVRVIYDSSRISYERLLQVFWENHDPTQGDRQGNDTGDQYRSLIMYFNDSQRVAAERSRIDYGNRLAVAGFPDITTQIVPAGPFYPGPEDHQQYLDRHPDGYCGLRGTGVKAHLTDISEGI